jgi:hypothetical protein
MLRMASIDHASTHSGKKDSSSMFGQEILDVFSSDGSTDDSDGRDDERVVGLWNDVRDTEGFRAVRTIALNLYSV